MKRNISVNIFGVLYHIDEDAYELLQQYNENMRRYYSKREGGEEIADDVEHRVAELLSELQSKGVLAITIDHVKEIIERIGDPQEMDDDNGNDSSTKDEDIRQDRSFDNDNATSSTNQQTRQQANTSYEPQEENTRKLFRDPDDKILGGVISGLCHYLGIQDPLLARILVVLLFFVTSGTMVFIYILAWILMPEAITPEDRLRMRGKPVSAKAINEELMRGVNNANQFVNNPQNRDTARGCLSAIFKFFIFSIALFFIFILGTVLLALLASLAGVSIATIFGGVEFIEAFGGNDISFIVKELPATLIAIMVASAFLIVGIPLYALIKVVFNKNDNNRMSSTTKVALIILWFLCIGALVGSGIRIAQKASIKIEEYQKKVNTRGGLYLIGEGWKILDRMGWDKVIIDGINKEVYEWGEMPDGRYRNFISLKAADNPNKMKYNLSQSRELTSGTYKVTADVRANGEGNSLYVLTNNNTDTLRVDIPKHKESFNEISDEEVTVTIDNPMQNWTHVEGKFTIDKEEKVIFGISNQHGYHNTPWNGNEIEIANVSIVQYDE